MQGFRTLIVAFVASMLVPWATEHGLTLTTAQQGWVVAVIMAVIMAVMRLFTTTPLGQSAKDVRMANAPLNKSAGRAQVQVLLVIFGMLLVLLGCQTLGITAPKTLDERIEYAYGGVDGALQAIRQATEAHQLSSQRASDANALVVSVKQILDAARADETTDVSAAQKDLNLAQQALLEVQKYLTQHGVKTP